LIRRCTAPRCGAVAVSVCHCVECDADIRANVFSCKNHHFYHERDHFRRFAIRAFWIIASGQGPLDVIS